MLSIPLLKVWEDELFHNGSHLIYYFIMKNKFQVAYLLQRFKLFMKCLFAWVELNLCT